MTEEKHTIACLIRRGESEFYVGDGWDNNIGRSCLYTPAQAQTKFKEIQSHDRNAMVCCVIQNKAFNYYDGAGFVYKLLEARLYSYEEAEAELKKDSC